MNDMRNIEIIKKFLLRKYPSEKERILSSDKWRVMNCWLQNERNRIDVAEGLKFTSKCEMCARKDNCSFDGNAFLCRQGILEWMDVEKK